MSMCMWPLLGLGPGYCLLVLAVLVVVITHTNTTRLINGLMPVHMFVFQWIFWVGPFIGAAIAAAYHQYILRAGAIKALGSFMSNPHN